MTVKKPNEWLDFVAKLGNTERVSLVGPLFNENFQPTEPTVFVDGGARFRRTDLEKFASIAVGDGDSGDSKLDVRLPEAKDFSDLAFVLSELPQTVCHLQLFGFWGGRLDHQLANLGELHAFLSKRPNSSAKMEDVGQVKAIGFNGKLEREISGIFSVMVLQKTAVEIKGACQYPLDKKRPLLPASSLGLSNQGHGLVQLESDSPAFLVLA